MSTLEKQKLIEWLNQYGTELINSSHIGPYSAANILRVIRTKVGSGAFDLDLTTCIETDRIT